MLNDKPEKGVSLILDSVLMSVTKSEKPLDYIARLATDFCPPDHAPNHGCGWWMSDVNRNLLAGGSTIVHRPWFRMGSPGFAPRGAHTLNYSTHSSVCDAVASLNSGEG
eukprot:COSAG02_NODE_2647_length_8336_cov_10.959087_2_plen_109_part_00